MSDNSNEILLQVNLETNNTTKKLEDIKTGITTLGGAVNELSKFFSVLSSGLTLAITSFTNNTSSLEKFINAINTSNSSIKDSNTNTNNLTASTNALNNAISLNVIASEKRNNTNNANINISKKEIEIINDEIKALEKLNATKKSEVKTLQFSNKQINIDNKGLSKTDETYISNVALKKSNTQDIIDRQIEIKDNNIIIAQKKELFEIASKQIKEQSIIDKKQAIIDQEKYNNAIKEQVTTNKNLTVSENELTNALKSVLSAEQEEIKAKKAIIDVSKALILGIDSEIKKQQEKIVIGLNLSNAEKQYNNEVRQTIALATEKKNKELELIASETQAIKILEGKATAENFDTSSIQNNTQALKNKQLSLTDLIAKEQEEKALLEATKKAKQDNIAVIQAQITNSNNLSIKKQQEIKEAQEILAQAKLEKKASQEFILSANEKINALKNERKEIDAVTFALRNRLEALKNNNVVQVSHNSTSNQHIQNLKAEAQALSVIPKAVKDNANAYDYFMDRVKSFTVGSLISSAIRNVTMEIKALLDTTTTEFLQFDRNIQKIRGVTQDNPQSYNAIGSGIQKSSNFTGSKVGTESENINTIITAGITDLSEATKVYEQSLILARTSVSATKTEQQALNEVMNSAIVVMNNYNLKASDLPTIFNQMSVAATRSRLDIGAFASKMGGLASTFAPFGTALNEAMSIFAVFSNKLKNENEADVALRAIAKKISSPTAQFKKEMIELQKMTGGTLIDLSPSAVKAQGFTNFVKNLINEISKTANPQDVVAKMLGLQNAQKGFQDLAAALKSGEIEKLTAESLNNVNDLKIKYEYIIQSLDSKLSVFKNSFINLFTNIFTNNEQTISDTFDKLIDFLNIIISLVKQLTTADMTGIGFEQIKAVLIAIKEPLNILLYGFEGLIKIISLFVNTTSGFFELFGLSLGAIGKRVFLLGEQLGNLWYALTDSKKYNENKAKIDKQISDISDIFSNRVDEIAKNAQEKLSNVFDLSKYATVQPQIFLDKKATNYAEDAKRKELKPPVTMVGTGEFDFNSKLAQEAMDQIEKENLSKKEYKLKKAKDKYQADLKKSKAEYEKSKLLIPQDIARLQTDLDNPEKTVAEKKALQDDIDTLNQKSINNQANFDKAQIALLKRFQVESKNINAEILKEKQDAIKKAEAEYKKKVEDKFLPLINDQKTRINRVDVDNQDKSEIQRLELKNIQIYKLIGLENQYANQFKKGSQERALILKQASISDLERIDNEKKISKLYQQNRLEQSKINYSNEKNLIKRQSSEGNFNKDVELNNENFLDKQRLIQIEKTLTSEKNLTFEQQKALKEERKNINQSILDNDLEMSKIKKQRIIDNVFFEIDQEKIKFNLLVEMGQKSNKAQLENDITTNNKMIAEYKDQISKLDKIKSSDKIDELNKKITPLQNANELDKYKINELSYKLQQEQDNKLFSDKQKSLELFRNLQIYSEETLSKELIKINDEKLQALQEQEKAFILTYGANPINEAKKQELDQLKESILDTNNFILLESKKLTDLIYQEEKRKLDIQLGFLDSYSSAFGKFGESLKNVNNDVFSLISTSFNSLSENYNKAIGIFRQIEPIQKQISDNKARQNTIKPLLDDEIAKYKQTGIPTTKLSNLVNENKSLESDNKLANQQANIIGIGTAFEILTGMISKGVDTFNKQQDSVKKLSQTYQLFGKDSKEVALAQGDLVDNQLEMLKVLPVVGDMLYKVVKTMSDFTGLTKSDKEKKDLKDIQEATLSYAKTKLNSTANYHETKLQLLEMDKQAELKTLSDMNLNQEAFDIKKAEILYKSNQKLLELNKDYYTQLNDLRNENTLLEIESIKSDSNLKFKAQLDYIKELDAIMKEYSLTYREMINSSDLVVQQKQLNADKKFQKAKNEIDLNRANETISIQKEIEKAKINLQEESLTKKYQLAFLEYQNEKDLALRERSSEKLNQEQYLKTLNLIELKYQKTQQDIKKESDDKLRGINEKNYNEELKAFESLNKNKTDKLKSELQKQYDIINEYEQKKKDLLESREQDQVLKVKRKNQLEIDLAKKKNDLLNNGAFYEQNQTNFETGNGLTTGNDTARKNITNDFDLGKITYLERNQKIQQLALEKQLYYQALLSKYQDPTKRAEINAKIQDATKEYYDFIFDKEQEKLDVEKQQAEKKIITLKNELTEREKLESEYITMLDNKYKDSAGLYKTAFVDATRDWIAFAQKETMQKLGVDTFKQLEKTANNLTDNKREAQKYMGNNPNASSSSSSSVSLPNNQQTNSTQNNINANNNAGINTGNTGFVYGPFDKPKDLVQPSTIGAAILEQQQKQKILANIYSQMGNSYYTQAERMTNSELLAFADKYNISKLAKGGVKNRGKMALVNEVEEEAFFNNSQIQNMYDYVLKTTSNNNVNNNSNINLNVTIQANSSDSKNLASEIDKKVNQSFKTLTDTLARGKK